jgi:murein DD-endopeptidase MepM/ murein hydrolase activator NlpD
MRYAFRSARLVSLTATFLICTAVSAAADANAGGTRAPAVPRAGGVEYGALLIRGPILSELSVPSAVAAGKLPRVSLRVEESGVGTVNAKLQVLSSTSHKPALTLNLGWIHTKRSVLVHWPKGATLPAGTYEISVSARDHNGKPLTHAAHISTQASFQISATLTPKITPPPAPVSVAPSPIGTPTPAETVTEGAIFPVGGAHNFGGPENRFGAQREGHIHQGQDVLASEGTPVLSPLAGTILTTDYQAGGAGYYAVEQTSVGFDFMFAHCEANSFAVNTGQAISAGQLLCKVGQTGDATAPHLHFEMWVGGWQAKGGQPIDPLPYLQAWEGSS